MTDKIIEGNKLIAEFRGYKQATFRQVRKHLIISSPPGSDAQFIEEHEVNLEDYWTQKHDVVTEKKNFSYHRSWLSLMPVVEDIMKIIESDKFFFHSFYIGVTSINAKVEVKRKFTEFSAYYVNHNSMVEAWFSFCVQFIKWYNQNK